MKGDYPSPKNLFPSPKMNHMKFKIDKIFDRGYSTLRTSNFPIEKSNKVEIGDLQIL